VRRFPFRGTENNTHERTSAKKKTPVKAFKKIFFQKPRGSPLQLDLSYTWNKRKTKTAGCAREGSGGALEGSGRNKAEKHLWDIIHARRRQLLPPKEPLLLNSTECTCRPYTSCHHCSEAKKKAEESCRQLRVLFYGSTNEIMTMDHSDADIIDLIIDQSIP